MGITTESAVFLLSALFVYIPYCATGIANSTTEPLSVTTLKRKTLHRVRETVRVPGCYFVNIRVTIPESEIRELIKELQSRDANASMPNFSAEEMFMITKLAYGFSAKLSDEALDYVS